MNDWVVKLDHRHRAAFEEMARSSRRTAADEVRYQLDRLLAAKALAKGRPGQSVAA